MTTLALTPTQVLAGIGVLLILLWIWRASVRRARAAADAAVPGRECCRWPAGCCSRQG